MLIKSKVGSGIAGTRKKVGLTSILQAWSLSMHNGLCYSLSFHCAKVVNWEQETGTFISSQGSSFTLSSKEAIVSQCLMSQDHTLTLLPRVPPSLKFQTQIPPPDHILFFQITTLQPQFTQTGTSSSESHPPLQPVKPIQCSLQAFPPRLHAQSLHAPASSRTSTVSNDSSVWTTYLLPVLSSSLFILHTPPK